VKHPVRSAAGLSGPQDLGVIPSQSAANTQAMVLLDQNVDQFAAVKRKKNISRKNTSRKS